VTYEYAPEALDVLAGHGLHPRSVTPPDVVRDALSDLYRYEIRRLKHRLRAGEFPKADYIDRVVALRRQYWLLSIPIERWVREQSPDHPIIKSPHL
jgi:hypothetical protein